MVKQEKWISYIRVSTKKQGKSGLGLEAQRAAVAAYLNKKGTSETKSGGRQAATPGPTSPLIKEYVEVESGKRTDRPKLAEAIQACKVYKAKLIIAKLDRLSRNAHFLLGLQEAGVEFVAVDIPFANRLTAGIMALMAEHEGQMISDRTKAALAAAKERGAKLGGDRGVIPTKKIRALAIKVIQERAQAKANDLKPIILELQQDGKVTLRALAAALNDAGIPTPREKGEWSAKQVQRILQRI
jgi:DNA invertase Pin-like site-specific DNA recombinase